MKFTIEIQEKDLLDKVGKGIEALSFEDLKPYVMDGMKEFFSSKEVWERMFFDKSHNTYGYSVPVPTEFSNKVIPTFLSGLFEDEETAVRQIIKEHLYKVVIESLVMTMMGNYENKVMEMIMQEFYRREQKNRN